MQAPQHYISQLDGLRAIAILLVIVFHWYPEGQGINIISNGPFGVTLFFVLSGFLITRILLASRPKVETVGILSVYKTFMIRRTLRIFPLYYLVLLLVWLARYIPALPPITTELYNHPLYYLLYGSNFLIETLHNWSDVLSPFWSLAVEEQFYIMWPFVILSVPTAWLKNVLYGTVVVGILFRAALILGGFEEGVLMPTCLDCFALGGIWAYKLFYKDEIEQFLKRLTPVAFGALGMFIYFCFEGEGSVFQVLFFRTSMALFCLYLVANASYSNGFSGLFGKLLNVSPLRYIGKVSYGLYVYHMLVPAFLFPLLIQLIGRFTGITIEMSATAGIISNFILLLLVASLSWFLYESPINNLKRKFPQ